MKKYIAPAIHMAEIELENMMISDSMDNDLDSNSPITSDDIKAKENYGDVSAWDEDEEEDITYAYRHKSIW